MDRKPKKHNASGYFWCIWIKEYRWEGTGWQKPHGQDLNPSSQQTDDTLQEAVWSVLVYEAASSTYDVYLIWKHLKLKAQNSQNTGVQDRQWKYNNSEISNLWLK